MRLRQIRLKKMVGRTTRIRILKEKIPGKTPKPMKTVRQKAAARKNQRPMALRTMEKKNQRSMALKMKAKKNQGSMVLKIMLKKNRKLMTGKTVPRKKRRLKKTEIVTISLGKKRMEGSRKKESLAMGHLAKMKKMVTVHLKRKVLEKRKIPTRKKTGTAQKMRKSPIRAILKKRA